MMKKNLSRSILFFLLGPALLLLAVPVVVFGARLAHRESPSDPNIVRLYPIARPGQTQNKLQTQALVSPSAAAASTQPTLGPNLILNPSLETAGSAGLPANWK